MKTLSGDSDAIRRVIEAFEKSNWSEIDVRVGSIRVHLSAGDPVASGSMVGAVRGPSNAPANPVPSARPEPQPEGPAPGGSSILADIPADALLIRSPSPGIFWRSPQPGAPPFADVGQPVDATATLCIVEVMKLMNHVKAGAAGTVVAVFGRDGVAVDRDEPLFAIDTSGRAA